MKNSVDPDLDLHCLQIRLVEKVCAQCTYLVGYGISQGNSMFIRSVYMRLPMSYHYRPIDYKTFILNSAEHEIYPAHKC